MRALVRMVAVAVFVGPLIGNVAAAPSASAAGYSGYCKDGNGVTVVIDFQQLGGTTVIRCAPGPVVPGFTGLDALKDAGVPYEGVRRWGDAFICRLYNRPSPAEDIPINGNPTYRERCIDTPPAAAYWSYWHAPNGGSWTYSQFGVKNRNAIKGGFEGWSFSLNATATTNPKPRIAPVRPVVASPKPTKKATPKPKAPAPNQPPPDQPPANEAPPPAEDPAAVPPAADQGPQPRPDASSAPTGEVSRAAPQANPAVAPTPTPAAPTADPTTDEALVPTGSSKPTGIPYGTAIAAGVGAFLLAGTVTTVLRRRRASRE